MGFNMNLIWGQEEVTQGEQGMTEHFGPAGGRDEDSLGLGCKRWFRKNKISLYSLLCIAVLYRCMKYVM